MNSVYESPLDNPKLSDYPNTLQFTCPSHFAIAPSGIENAGNGLWFKGSFKKNEAICGYGGKISLAKASKSSSSKYQAMCGKSGYVIDAAHLANLQYDW